MRFFRETKLVFQNTNKNMKEKKINYLSRMELHLRFWVSFERNRRLRSRVCRDVLVWSSHLDFEPTIWLFRWEQRQFWKRRQQHQTTWSFRKILTSSSQAFWFFDWEFKESKNSKRRLNLRLEQPWSQWSPGKERWSRLNGSTGGIRTWFLSHLSTWFFNCFKLESKWVSGKAGTIVCDDIWTSTIYARGTSSLTNSLNLSNM